MFKHWFRKKETRAERMRRELQSFNEEHLPLTHLPELDTPPQHTPPLGLDLNVPYLLKQVIPKQLERLQRERTQLVRRLAEIDHQTQVLTDLQDVTKRVP